MPRHVITMVGVVFSFFLLLWFGVVVLGQPPGRTMLVTLLTLVLIGLGVTIGLAALRHDKPGCE